MSDSEEEALGTDPLDTDSDDDGASDGIEVTYGTSPTVGDDTPPVPSLTWLGLFILAALLLTYVLASRSGTENTP